MSALPIPLKSGFTIKAIVRSKIQKITKPLGVHLSVWAFYLP